MKTLIAYFSHIGENLENNEIVNISVGNTFKVANIIKELTGADLYEIKEKDKYPLDYDSCLKRAKLEDENNSIISIASETIDISQYEVIYLGFPIWYRTFPRIISSFIKNYDFKDKIIKPFCTNDEGTFGISLLELEDLLKNSIIKDSLAIRGVDVNNSLDKIKKFVQE